MIVSVTRLHLLSLWSFPTFFWHAMASTRQIRRAPGFIAGWLGGESAYGQWTATVWESEAAMRAFRNSEAHLKAMPRLNCLVRRGVVHPLGAGHARGADGRCRLRAHGAERPAVEGAPAV
ncbi:MAG: antibiotic biosynthesis monooxygenase [Vicinamibacterales bacterium]